MQHKTFVHQLHSILSDPTLTGIINWNDDEIGTVFLLKPYHPEFCDNVLKRYFKHGNVSSFVRQLHMYGFHKVGNNSVNSHINNIEGNKIVSKKEPHFIIWKFSHPSGNFHRESSYETLCKITRKPTGFGKDGKRKNILSPIAISYLNPGIKIELSYLPFSRAATGIDNFDLQKENMSYIESATDEALTTSTDTLIDNSLFSGITSANSINTIKTSGTGSNGITTGSSNIQTLINNNIALLKKTTLLIIEILDKFNNPELSQKSEEMFSNLQKLQELKNQLVSKQCELVNMVQPELNSGKSNQVIQSNQYPTPSQFPNFQNYFPSM